MADKFKNYGSGLDSPARNALEVVPSDVADLAQSSRALYVGAPGDLTLDTVGGDTATLVGVSGLIPICARRIRALGTTADQIVALW